MNAQQLLSKMKIKRQALQELIDEDDGTVDIVWITECKARKSLLDELIADLEKST